MSADTPPHVVPDVVFCMALCCATIPWRGNMLTGCRYGLYHSLLAVVRHCYRPSGDGDELAARRTLVSTVFDKQLLMGKVAPC